ncbi:mandelate racemase/muconate lactonizing enzyme family protein [Microlunatus speluncae]|uniref:mandelate racemase/muconate lactonizing enzyme family protein n=1 Tax=Microlunatus speluncae TaxID=2594267 RepID=UPI001375C425|nr:mandelate racemase/muconate lactonizing enzyme family protein [Microlunatus speluncae]
MRIRDVTPFLLRGSETYGSGATGDEATDQGDWLLLIRVRTTDGLQAWADVETLAPVAARVVRGDGMGAMGFKTLEELIAGRDVEDSEELDLIWQELFIGSVYYGRRGVALQALSAIDNCLWALLAQRDGVDLAELLGGRRHDRIPAYASTLFRSTPEGNAAAARSYRDRGFRGVKFGWGGFGVDAGRDAENLAAITAELGDDHDLMVDPGWYVADHDRPRLRTPTELRAMLELLDDVRPTWVEDIVHPEEFEQYADLRCDFPELPFAAGEQQATRWELERLIATGGLRYLQPDLSRCGGLTVARRLVGPAVDHGVQLVTHSWLTDLLHHYSLHLLATLPAAPWVEFNVAQSTLSRGVVRDPLQLGSDGTVQVPVAVPDVDEAFITQHAVALSVP